MPQKALEARFEAGTGPGTSAGVASAFSAKQIYLPSQEFAFDPNASALRRDDEMRGFDEPISFVQEEFRPSWSLSQRMYPDSMGFLLKALLGAPTTTTGDGIITDLGLTAVPAGAYRHRWTAPYGASGTPMTTMFRALMTDESLYWDVRGATVQSLEISTPDTGGVMVTASGLANYVSNIANPSLTPTYESLAIEPFLKSFATLTWLSGSASTETIGWSISQAKDHTRTFGGASKYPDLVEYGEGVPEVGFSIDKRALDVDDWNALIGATRFTVLSGWVHQDFITGSYPYKVYIQGPSTAAAYLAGGSVSLANRRRTPTSFSGILSRESAASSIIEVVNATASYA